MRPRARARVREEGVGTVEQRDRRRDVVSRRRPSPCRLEQRRCLLAEPRRAAVVDAAELAEGAARLLQVMPGQVLGARCPLRVGEEPPSERLVKPRSRRLRDPGVGSIPDETVGEAVSILSGGAGRGSHEPGPRQREEGGR